MSKNLIWAKISFYLFASWQIHSLYLLFFLSFVQFCSFCINKDLWLLALFIQIQNVIASNIEQFWRCFRHQTAQSCLLWMFGHLNLAMLLTLPSSVEKAICVVLNCLPVLLGCNGSNREFDDTILMTEHLRVLSTLHC